MEKKNSRKKLVWEPVLIGRDDAKINKIRDLYSKLVTYASLVLSSSSNLIFDSLENEENWAKMWVDFDTFVKIVRSNDPESIIMSERTKNFPVSTSGIDVEKLVELKLIQIDKAGLFLFGEELKDLKAILKEIALVQYFYPLRKLLTNSNGKPEFEVNPSFEKELIEKFSFYTASPEETGIFTAVQNFAKAVNGLAECGFISLKNGIGLDKPISLLDLNRTMEMVSIDAKITSWTIKKATGGTRDFNPEFKTIEKLFN